MEMKTTSLGIVAEVSRLVTTIIDRVAGDRSDYPLLVATAAHHALKKFEIKSNVFYGKGAWLEVLSDQTVAWTGAWESEERPHFWLATQFGEIVDLNTSVSHRQKRFPEGAPEGLKVLYSPPMVWAMRIPNFYKYEPIGHVEVENEDARGQKLFSTTLELLDEKITMEKVQSILSENKVVDSTWFANEAILTPELKILDDSELSFKHYDRTLAVQGIPRSPF